MTPDYEDSFPDQQERDALTWKPLRLLTFYRLILAGLLTTLFFSIPDSTTLGILYPGAYAAGCIGYLAFALLAGFTTRLRHPGYEVQATVQILIDIIAVTLLMFASNGLASGLGILLLISVAAGSILLPGRMAFLFAAVATMAVIGEQLYSTLLDNAPRTTDYTQSGLLGIALFATAGLTYLLVRRIHESEALARRRGIDLANLAKLNALIVQRLQAGIIVTDHDDHVRLINETARKLLDSNDTETTQPLAVLSPALQEQLENWRRHPDSEPSLLENFSGTTNLLPHFTPLGTADGPGSLIFLEDTASMAKQAQQMKLASLGRLTASIAHEIRNPLGAISHATQLLKESEALNDGDRRLVTIIGDHTRRVNSVVENVLQLSRPGASLPQRLRLQDWLRQFVDEFSHSGVCRPEQIEYAVTDPDLEIYIDPSLLHQVVWNLCLNAVNHARPDAEALQIRLAASCPGSATTVRLDIMDNGQGIQADMTDKIFEPFFTTRSNGTGLGLYISREICESNQARLEYLPATAGGSCFRINFPRVGGLSVPLTE
ncbi:MAG: ATP-binding protein [Gammaproteobacteria bacterium]|jgi:two-component system sensor histidine kinase PilS (NtrC family)